MAYFKLDPNEDDEKRTEAFRAMISPGQIDHTIRQTIQFLWMMMPKEKRNVDEVEKELRRLVDRAVHDLREDFDAFFRKDKK
jgi:hypothetical protein